jgi:hypothetical protein
MNNPIVTCFGSIGISILCWLRFSAQALPPPEDIPEEILRIQPDLRSQSSQDNRPLSPHEYQTEQSEQSKGQDPEVTPEVMQLIYLLRIRQGLRSIIQ